MTETTTKTVRTPAQLAAIRRSYGLRKGEEARKEAQKQRIQQYYKDKFREEKKAEWLRNKIKEGYRARAAKKRAEQAA